MRFFRYYLLVILLTVPVLMQAQDAVSSGDSIVSMKDLHRVHRLEREAFESAALADIYPRTWFNLALRTSCGCAD